MSTGEKNKALVCRFLEAQSTGDLEALFARIPPQHVRHLLLRHPRAPECYPYLRQCRTRAALPTP